MTYRRLIPLCLFVGLVAGTTLRQPTEVPGQPSRLGPVAPVNDRGALLPIDPVPSPRYVRSLTSNAIGFTGFYVIDGASAVGTRPLGADNHVYPSSNLVVIRGLISTGVVCVDPDTGAPLADYEEVEIDGLTLRRYPQPAMVIGYFSIHPDNRFTVLSVLGEHDTSVVWLQVHWPLPSTNVTDWPATPSGDL